jgi:hypothetical protein
MKLEITKNGNQIGVYVKIPSKAKPVFVHRITLHWTDGKDSAVGLLTNYIRPDLFVEEGVTVLVASMDIPNGAASVRADACYEVVDGFETAKIKL